MPPSPKTATNRVYDGDNHESSSVNRERTLAKGIAFVVLLAAATLLLLSFYSNTSVPGLIAPAKIYAKALLRGNDGVNGTIHFEQNPLKVGVRLTGRIQGLDPKALRGFHIHQYGDLSDGCISTGSHFNPTSLTHGAPSDTIRHIGDLGNIESDKHGIAELEFTDYVISLIGGNSIVGRAVVIHTGTDDLGRGNNDESKRTGNAGGRAACGIIGLAASSD